MKTYSSLALFIIIILFYSYNSIENDIGKLWRIKPKT